MSHPLQTNFDRFSLNIDSAQSVARLDCRAYRVRTRAGPGPAREWALRIYPFGRPDTTAIQDELACLSSAAAQGLHVPCPQANLEGHLIQ